MLLYKISLLEECGFFEKALEELQKKELKIVDKLAYKEQEVSLLVKLDCLEEGEKLYRALLSMNPDNYRYYEGLQKCVGLYSENGHFSPDEIDRLDALYKTLGQQYKWSSAVKNGKCWLTVKWVSHLYSLIFLHIQSTWEDILEQIILELESSIKTTGQYPGRYISFPIPSLVMEAILYILYGN
uniref:NMDA receptor-regulated protein 1 n=1 Tax=Cajanus cajan TaxID=3821 RepID=A0A151QPN8_CAJCA|nr:NMDA receptor-regulated protein 1 [Cajanus cajan]